MVKIDHVIWTYLSKPPRPVINLLNLCFCCEQAKRANSEIKAVRPQGLMGWCNVLKRYSLSVPQPRFHVETVRKVYSVSIFNIYFFIQLKSYLSHRKMYLTQWRIFFKILHVGLLGLSANSIETENHNRKFYWTGWRVLIKIFPG